MMFKERIKQLYEDRRMPQRKLDIDTPMYSKIERGEQVIAFVGNFLHFAGKQIFLPNDTTRENVVQHIHNIIAEGELSKEATHKNFLLVRQEGNRSVKRQIEHYNPDMLIAVGNSFQTVGCCKPKH